MPSCWFQSARRGPARDDDFAEYPKLVPYISRTSTTTRKGLLLGRGIWKFRLLSLLKFN